MPFFVNGGITKNVSVEFWMGEFLDENPSGSDSVGESFRRGWANTNRER
jgi:hypothetical protein